MKDLFYVTVRLGVRADNIEEAKKRGEQIYNGVDTWRYVRPTLTVTKAKK